MLRRHRHKHRREEELDVTVFLNLMVVLIPFLLLTAVFTRITIQELNLPSQSTDAAPPMELVTIEVIVRKDTLEISNGKNVTATIPKLGNKHDYDKLSMNLLGIKERNSHKEDLSILVEPDIEYETLIGVMDAVKYTEISKPGQDKAQKVILFPQISIGDAP